MYSLTMDDGSTHGTQLEATPFVSIDPRRQNLVHCPVPLFLLRRIRAQDFERRGMNGYMAVLTTMPHSWQCRSG
jgi:hypothetical protein